MHTRLRTILRRSWAAHRAKLNEGKSLEVPMFPSHTVVEGTNNQIGLEYASQWHLP